jgi:hypothetical protein
MIEKDITPVHLRCGMGNCESVFVLNDGKLLIIGKKLSAELAAEIGHKVAPSEEAIVIDPAYFSNLSQRT